jgi:hypothetical protein
MTSRLKSFATMTLVAAASAGAFWLLREHWQHARGFLVYLPYLFFFACPLMHLFMHHGHGHGDHQHELLQDGLKQSPAGRSPDPELPR